MEKEKLQILSTLAVTVLLILFAALLVVFVPGPSADTLGSVIITAVVAKWLHAEAQQNAEKTAEKLQEAVVTAKNGHSATTETMNVDAGTVEVTETTTPGR